MTREIKLIYTEERRGLGKPNDPIRKIAQLWTTDGKLIIEELDKHDIKAGRPELNVRDLWDSAVRETKPKN